jgi:hypothetical protein
MKTAIRKKLVSFILLASGMFCVTFVNAQPCSGNKIRVYGKCTHGFNCNSHCVSPGSIPAGWTTYCPCWARLANGEVGAESLSLAVSPNPVLSSTVISFFLEQSEKASLNIFDVNGRLVTTLGDASFEEGHHEITWNAGVVNAGIYFLRIETATYSENRKLIVMK